MSKRVVISTEALNSYGFRVLTDGIDTEQYERNPVLLYMHRRGDVIGYMKDLRREDGRLTGELVLDCASELSERCRKQVEFGSLRMVSPGLELVEMSEDKALLVPGQTSPTVTRCRLFEVSLADVGANDEAMVLMRDGKQITLGRDGGNPLPLLNINPKTNNEMDTKTIALQLGLPETATEAELTVRLAELSAARAENEKLRGEIATLQLERITSLVEAAVADRRLAAGKKEHFIELGKKLGAGELSSVLDAMQPQASLAATLKSAAAQAHGAAGYKKLSEVPEAELLLMRGQDPDEYKRLYEAEYGVECRIESAG